MKLTKKEKLDLIISKGYTADVEKGIIYNTRKLEANIKPNKKGYISIRTEFDGYKFNVMAHHLIYYIATNKIVECIDHIDRDKTNNKIGNLRSVTENENLFNTDAKGVYFNKKHKKFIARIQFYHKSIYLGSFEKEEDARNQYLIAKNKVHNIGSNCVDNIDELRKSLKGTNVTYKNYSFNSLVNKYIAEVSIKKTRYVLGYYETESEAIDAVKLFKNNPDTFEYKSKF